MEETKRLYLEDPYRTEFEAKVKEKTIYEQKPALILDQTCFYPESGGQPSDKGTIDHSKVLAVIQKNERILHVLDKDVLSQKVKGKIDWEIRFDHMQQHAGQHILSQSFHSLLRGKTLSFHLGKDFSSIEIDLRKISEEDVENVEILANKIVFQDREIHTIVIPEKNVGSVPLRKPPVKKGLIRVVEVSGFDYSACGGTHPRRTGEIGLIKVLKWEKIRNNIRFEFVCGNRALRDYMMRNRVLRQAAVRLTVNELDVAASVEKLSADYKDQKRTAKKMQEKILQYEAQEIVQSSKERIFRKIFTDRMLEEVRLLALLIIKKGDYTVLFGLKKEERAHLVLACAENLGLDMRELIPVVSPFLKGKGGGRPSLVEISGERSDNLNDVLEKAYQFIKNKSEKCPEGG